MAVKFLAIPTRGAALHVSLIAVHHMIALAPDRIGRLVASRTRLFIPRCGIGQATGIEAARRCPILFNGVA